MRSILSLFLQAIFHWNSYAVADGCVPGWGDEWISCEKYKKCFAKEHGANYYRTIHCNHGHVAVATIQSNDEEVGVIPAVACVLKSSLACDSTCANACPTEAPIEAPIGGIHMDGGSDGCIENSVAAISCTKYQLCVGGVKRNVHCNAGLVHDGHSTECQLKSTLPAGSKCGDSPQVVSHTGCIANSVDAVSCTTYRLCVGGVKRLVHCNQGLVHDGVSPECQPKSSLPAGNKCGHLSGCIENSVIPISCTQYRLCVGAISRLVHCNAGLFHDGVSTGCLPKSALPIGSHCGEPLGCVANSVAAVTCTSFKLCTNGAMHLVQCNNGLVHDGVSAKCVPASSLSCGSKCGLSCTPHCVEGHVVPIDCNQFRVCSNGYYRLSHCNDGLVNQGDTAVCVSKASIACGGTCGFPCAPVCVEGSSRPISCEHFDVCVNGNWKPVTCNSGLVHEGNTAACVAKQSMPCGSACGYACPTIKPITECNNGAVRPISCTKFQFCVNDSWKISTCKPGLVNLGVEAKCIPKWALACGTSCGDACPTITPVADNICMNGDVIPVSCHQFKLCVDGNWKMSTCKSGLVNLGQEALCVPMSSLDCGSQCGSACPTPPPVSEISDICENGAAEPVSCKKFKYCVDGDWKMSYCKRGLVHVGDNEAQCVLQTSLACGSQCALSCPTESINDIELCEDGEFIPVDCNRFRFCVNGAWKTSYCHEGLVHLGNEAQCVPQLDLECGTTCAMECPVITEITDCEPGAVKDESCWEYAVCDADGFWQTTTCEKGMVHVPGAGCVDYTIIACTHKCGPKCPEPEPCPVCPISDCPMCPKLIEYKCPCDTIRKTMQNMKDDISLLIQLQMDETACEAAPTWTNTTMSVTRRSVVPSS